MELFAESLEVVSRGRAGQAQLAACVDLTQAGEKLAAKERAQNADWEQEVLARTDPVLATERQAAAGNDAVKVGMKEKLTRPGVQHAGDAKLGAEPAGIAAELEQRFRCAIEEHVEEQCTVGER